MHAIFCTLGEVNRQGVSSRVRIHRGKYQLTFMCDDIQATIRELRAKGIEVKGKPEDEDFGITANLPPPRCHQAEHQPRRANRLDLTALI